VWDVNKKVFHELRGHTAPVNRVVFSPKGTYLLTASTDGTAIVWNTRDWASVSTLKPQLLENQREKTVPVAAGQILSAAFDATEALIVTGHQSGAVGLWDARTGENLQITPLHKKGVLSVAFNRAGDLLLTGSADTTAGVWTLDGTNRITLAKHSGSVTDARFSQDEQFIVTAGSDGTVRVWENNLTGALVSVFEPLDMPASVALSPNNKFVAVGGYLGVQQIFACDACVPFSEIKLMAERSNPRELTKFEKRAYGIVDEDGSKK